MTKFGAGWDPKQIQSKTPAVEKGETHSLTQAIEEAGIFEDEPLRLIYELLTLLNKRDSELHSSMDFRNMIPKILSAVGSFVDETDKRDVLKSILTPIMDRDEMSEIATEKGEVDFLDFLVKTIRLRAFVKAILRSADIAGSSAAEPESIIDDGSDDSFEPLLLPAALEDISRDEDTATRDKDTARIERVLTTSIQEKSSELAAAIFRQLKIKIDSRITVVEFTLKHKILEDDSYSVEDIAPENPFKIPSHYQYSHSPIPEAVLNAVRDKFFEKTGAPELQRLHSLIRDAIDQTESWPETFLKKLSQRFSRFRKVPDGATGMVDKILSTMTSVSNNTTGLSDIFEDVRLTFLNFDWMILPIARYAMQQATQSSAPLEVLKNSETLADEIDVHLENFFDFSLSAIGTPTEISPEPSRGPNPLSGQPPSPMLLALLESVQLGHQALNRAKDRLQQRPKPYDLVLQTMIDSYRTSINTLAQRLNLSPEFNPIIGTGCGPYNFLNHHPKKGHRRREAGQKIYVPMSYGSEAILENADNDNNAGILLPCFVDLSYWLPPVGAGQGNLPTCTAYVVKTVVEFLHRREAIREKPFTASASFLYKLTLDRKPGGSLDSSVGLPGMSIRDTIQTLVELGVPEEKDWPYPAEDEPDAEEMIAKSPPSACYFSARKFKINKYFQIDKHAHMSRSALLAQIKAILASGLPCIFALKAMEALKSADSDKKGRIPYLPETESDGESGHALVAVGYDDTFAIGDNQGALLVRNSWGSGWGNQGYGWLPYQYVLEQKSDEQKSDRVVDCWVLLEWEWTKKGKFGLSPEGWRDNLAEPKLDGQT